MAEQKPKKKEGVSDPVKRAMLGFIIGIASVTPGLSGGVIAAAVGLYEPAVRAFVRLPRAFIENFLFLLPLGLGLGLGVLLSSRVMEILFVRWEFLVLYIFLGLVIGSVPSLLREANREGFHWKYLVVAGITLATVILLDHLAAGAPDVGGEAGLTVVGLLIYGGILAIGTIIPGISSSFILMYLGVYTDILSAIAGIDIPVLFWLALGYAAAALLLIKAVEFLFRRFHGYAYYAVLGFLVGTMLMVFPGFRGGFAMAADLALLISSAALTLVMMRKRA